MACTGVLWLAAGVAGQNGVEAFERDVRPFLQSHCVACHTGDDAEADLVLLDVLASASSPDFLPTALLVQDVLEAADMPPQGAEIDGVPVPRPSREDVAAVVRWAKGVLAVDDGRRPDPGRVTTRRLSRTEYGHAIRDLFGIDASDLVARFPVDDLAHGFDNLGDARSTSPLHLEKFAAAAAVIAERAIRDDAVLGPATWRLQGEDLEISSGREPRRSDTVAFFSRGSAETRLELPRPGRYRIVVRAFADQAGDDVARLGLIGPGAEPLAILPVHAQRDQPEELTFETDFATGDVRLGVSFVNDYYEPDHPDPRQRDRNLYVDWIEVVGPLDPTEPTYAERWILAPDPGTGRTFTRAKGVVERILTRVWRRAPTSAQVRALTRLVADEVDDRGGSFRDGVRLALQAALTSPRFLFRIEDTVGSVEDGSVALDDWSLATRLAFLIWSSAPDEPLLERAAAGELRDPAVLREEAMRMLGDARADALVTNFATQWLELRALEEATPDPDRFPEFDAALAASMRRETEAFVLDNFRRRRPLRELLVADHTFLDERLARHYEVRSGEVFGDEVRRVELDDDTRGGLLTHASVLTITSNPTRTSPVRRGKWVLDNIVGSPPPPPPPAVDALPEPDPDDPAASLRERFERHRTQADCAVCHARMDAFGFVLENYDAIGRFRVADPAGGLIDAKVELPDGTFLTEARDLRGLLARDHAFVRTVLRKLFVFGVGRPTAGIDEVLIEARARALGPDATLADLVLELVALDAFRRRSADS
jgi:hypothetical protein